MMIIQEAELIPFYSHCQKYLCIYFYHRGWAILKLQKEKHCLTSYKGTSRCNNNNEKKTHTHHTPQPFFKMCFLEQRGLQPRPIFLWSRQNNPKRHLYKVASF